jgi:phosphoribosylamine--glycine ligase
MLRLDSDLVEILEAIVGKRIAGQPVNWGGRSGVCVVITSGGYPGDFTKGRPISGLDEAAATEDVVVFHAGTSRNDADRLVTSGGRVLGVSAVGRTVSEARKRVYEAVGKIKFEGMHYRRDIAAILE